MTGTVHLYRIMFSGHIGAAEGHVAVDPAAGGLIQREALLMALQSPVRRAASAS